MATSDAPTEIDRVRLVTRDLDRMRGFYTAALGLSELAADRESATLGVDDRPLLELRRDAAARPRDPRAAGLFHTAFLLPSRAALGSWLRHAADTGLQLQGASDHIVSEAIYLADPEGNGIEVYADRPRSAWHRDARGITMTTEPLDGPDLLAAADGPWRDAPEGTVIGHVHLQVGDVSTAEAFYAENLGFEVTYRIPKASFYGSGGYHHHLATNTWSSHGAGPRQPGSTGLDAVVLRSETEAARIATDPWGTSIEIERKQS
ncbi:VOC family protein (plasmid) [Limimaricola variabilis]